MSVPVEFTALTQVHRIVAVNPHDGSYALFAHKGIGAVNYMLVRLDGTKTVWYDVCPPPHHTAPKPPPTPGEWVYLPAQKEAFPELCPHAQSLALTQGLV